MSVTSRGSHRGRREATPRARVWRGPVVARSADVSPTTSIYRVTVTLCVAALITIVLTARGIVHSGNGMPYGPMRTATLYVGNAALQIAEKTHLTWPWDTVQSAIGQAPQPAIAPLLLAAPKRPVAREAPGSRGAGHALTSAVGPRGREWSGNRSASRAAVPQTFVPPLHHLTASKPLRLLVAGDSLVGYLGPELVDEMSRRVPLRGFVDSHNGTGLTRPDFVDWSLVARQEITSDHPDVTVVLIGGNDFQNMTLPNGKVFVAGTPVWTREYERRAAICMRIWTRGGHRLYWLSVPPARDSGWAYDDTHINLAIHRAAARVPGAHYVDVLGPISNHGKYTDFATIGGQETLIRESDGVHLNISGSRVVAHEVRDLLSQLWQERSTSRTIARPR